MSRTNPLSEASMLSAEAKIPKLAAQAGRAAHQRALSEAGRVVMKSVNGLLVEKQSSGVTAVIKALPPSTPALAGMVLQRSVRKAASGR